MARKLDPVPSKDDRKTIAARIRERASAYADTRRHKNEQDDPKPFAQKNNGESVALDPPVGTYTKGLPHDDFGLVSDGHLIDDFITAINQPTEYPKSSPFPNTYVKKTPAQFKAQRGCDTPLGATTPCGFNLPKSPSGSFIRGRSWESPLAGHTYDLEGPDADALGAPPAPKISSPELLAEMAELYAMALLRDVPFEEIETGKDIDGCGTAGGGVLVGDLLAILNTFDWFRLDVEIPGLSRREMRRRCARFLEREPKLSLGSLFRGSPMGAKVGPYLSQFLLIGSAARDNVREIVDSPDPTVATALKIEPEGLATRSADDASSIAGQFVTRTLSAQVAGRIPAVIRANVAGGADPADAAHAGVSHAGVDSGFILYGAQIVNQRLLPHRARSDYMVDWASWIDVQNGADRRGMDKYEPEAAIPELGRFIHRPRDLATFVHFDALYQAYLNACLILLSLRAPTDRGLPSGVGAKTRGAFATFGDPHILTLVTEVATRALKVVRRQKYQIHLRSRPEAVAASLTLAASARADLLKNSTAALKSAVSKLRDSGLAALVDARNKAIISELGKQPNDPTIPRKTKAEIEIEDLQVKLHDKQWIAKEAELNLLLAQSFPEGSPMHPSYGAGHATVAGACTTVLKSFFEMYTLGDSDFVRDETTLKKYIDLFNDKKRFMELYNSPLLLNGNFEKVSTDSGVHYFKSPVKGVYRTTSLMADALVPVGDDSFKVEKNSNCFEGAKLKCDQGREYVLTIEGELDKLATNIAIARNFAGVHYYSDYYESLRLGERVAVGILQEQMLTYREPVSMRFRSFDGDYVLIYGTGGSRGLDDANVLIRNVDGDLVSFDDWWNRALDEAG